MTPLPRVRIERPSLRHAADFLESVQRSRALHGRWVHPPATLPQYRAFLRRMRGSKDVSHLVCSAEGDLAGMININEIVRGSFCSGYLGYYAFAPQHGHGYMRAGLARVVGLAFRKYGLHRLEANIQPEDRGALARS